MGPVQVVHPRAVVIKAVGVGVVADRHLHLDALLVADPVEELPPVEEEVEERLASKTTPSWMKMKTTRNEKDTESQIHIPTSKMTTMRLVLARLALQVTGLALQVTGRRPPVRRGHSRAKVVAVPQKLQCHLPTSSKSCAKEEPNRLRGTRPPALSEWPLSRRRPSRNPRRRGVRSGTPCSGAKALLSAVGGTQRVTLKVQVANRGVAICSRGTCTKRITGRRCLNSLPRKRKRKRKMTRKMTRLR